MIDGLKLTLSGEEVRKRIEDAIQFHCRCVKRWKRELRRTPADQTEEEPLLPEHICENSAEEHEWRVEVLTFIRDHIEPGETYRLVEKDLEFGELLPEKPGWMKQHEYEKETGIAFNLERLVKEVRMLDSGRYLPASHDPEENEGADSHSEPERRSKLRTKSKRKARRSKRSPVA